MSPLLREMSALLREIVPGSTCVAALVFEVDFEALAKPITSYYFVRGCLQHGKP